MTAPCGFCPAHSPCLMGTPKSQGNGVHAGSVRAGFWGPLGPAIPAGKTRRAAHKDVRRFRPGQEAPSENSRRDCAPAAQRRADRRGVLSLLTFFAQAKKVRPPRPAAPCPNPRPHPSKAMNPMRSLPDVRIALTANAAGPREVLVAGLRYPSPQPLSPTGTSFACLRERGFHPPLAPG